MSAAVIVAGLEPLGLAVVQRLRAAGVEVCTIASPADALRYSHELERLGAKLITGSARSAGELLAAGVESTGALVLTADDDAENVDAALTARALRSDIPLVVRLFDSVLERYFSNTLEHVTVLSISGVTAPVFTEMAERALAQRSQDQPPGSRPARATRRPRRRYFQIDRVLAGTVISLLALVIVATAAFSYMRNLRSIDALYFVWTTITTVGYGDIALRDASDTAKIVGMVLMFGGAAFLASLYAFFTDAVVARRIAALQGRVAVKGRHHVVVIGSGNVGFRTARILGQRGHRVIIVERRADIRNVTALREYGHQVIIADAAVNETLDLAGVDNAGVIIALTNSDSTNLNIALKVRARHAGVPVVARLDSPALSEHVSSRHEALSVSSIAIASLKFSSAALSACGIEKALHD